MNFINAVNEAISAVIQSKTRSILAGFGVAWGIFILIILLGTGKGFRIGILQQFSFFAKNSIWVYGGEVAEDKLNKTLTHKFIQFDNSDLKFLAKNFSEIESISPEINYAGNPLTFYEQNSFFPQIKGVTSDYFNVKIIKTEEGRLLNILDSKENQRVALIGRQVADGLFPNETAIGKSIDIVGTYFRVVGVIEKGSFFSQNEQNVIYIPYSSFLECFNTGTEYSAFVLALSKKTDANKFENKLKSFLARRKGFDVNDKKAVFIINFENQTKAFDKLFKGVDIFLWFIGLCLLFSGIINISNIMIIIVKERTVEIGIRKAIGAKSSSILRMIIIESIIITSFAGVIGLIFGALFIYLINWILPFFLDNKNSLFVTASIDFPVIIFSLVVLILAGLIAGFVPARKASNITPVEAMRSDF